MKLEEVLLSVREGKKFEDFEYKNYDGRWIILSEKYGVNYNELIEKEFRVKVEKRYIKLKKYPIIIRDGKDLLIPRYRFLSLEDATKFYTSLRIHCPVQVLKILDEEEFAEWVEELIE